MVRVNRLSISEGMNMNTLKKLVLTLTLTAGISANAATAEFTVDTDAINDSVNTRVSAKIDALNEHLSAKVTAMIEAILEQGRVQRAQEDLTKQPYSLLVVPSVESERFSYDLKKNRS